MIMATLKGLFDPKPRSQRNFLLENKREVKAKSSTNAGGQKNAIPVNVQKPRTFMNSLQTSSRPSITSNSLRSKQYIKYPASSEIDSKSAQYLRKGSAGKQQACKQVSKPKESMCSLKSASSTRTVNYIHQENVPFEWTEVCPSLISHNICHQGVQTDRQCENLTEDLKLLGTEDVTDTDCDKRSCQALRTAPPTKLSYNGYSENNCSPDNITGRKTTNSSQDNMGIGLSLTTDNIQGSGPKEKSVKRFLSNENNAEVQADSDHICHASTGKSSLVVSHHDKPQVLTCRKLTSNHKAQGDSCLYPVSYQKGVIPKYLTKRKTEQALAAAQAKGIDPNCPARHIVMPDNERRETLDMILKNYNDLIIELNRIPVRTDTLKMKQRKIEIEKQLDKLEEGIRVFSRSKVYVKLDE